MNRPIVIAAASIDQHAYGPVGRMLEENNYPVVIYKTDKVLDGSDTYSADISKSGELDINYNGTKIGPNDIGAAWYRKVGNFSIESAINDKAKHLYLVNEIRHFHEDIWSLYPEDIWLNDPRRMRQADQKMGQLLLAKKVGFSIPDTTISNDWGHIESKIIKEDDDEIIVKMIKGVVSENDSLKAMYTTSLNKDKVDKIRDKTVPFPGIYQPFIDKAKEWRVTVVGEDIYPAAIYTDSMAKVDWRTHQLTKSVQFVAEDLEDEVGEKCSNYLKEMGLKYGAFDLIESHDGDITFLECNPNGQYGWLEEEQGFPISRSISNELIKIAESTK